MQVILADDATTVRLYYRSILEGAGFSVIEAMNGLEALERALASEQRPDLFIVDVNMPLMDGYTLVRAIRAEPTLHDVPAIMISTESASRDAELAFGAGANLFLVKPAPPDALLHYASALAGLRLEAR